MYMSHDTYGKSYDNYTRVIQQSHDIPDGHNEKEQNPSATYPKLLQMLLKALQVTW